MRFVHLFLILAAVSFLTGCMHLNGTIISFAKYGESVDRYYEILPGEAAHEWMPKLIKELQPFEDGSSGQAGALRKKCQAYINDLRGASGMGGEIGAKGNEIVRKYFGISLVFATYKENKIESGERYLFTKEGVVRVKFERGKKSMPEFFRPAPGLRGLIEMLFTPEAQGRYRDTGH